MPALSWWCGRRGPVASDLARRPSRRAGRAPTSGQSLGLTERTTSHSTPVVSQVFSLSMVRPQPLAMAWGTKISPWVSNPAELTAGSSRRSCSGRHFCRQGVVDEYRGDGGGGRRSEEHTSELQSRQYLVCR